MADPPRRPFLMQILAALLTFYAMTGVWLAMTMLGNRDERFHWIPLVAGGAVFAIASGASALAVWRLESRAPRVLMSCAVVGAVLCTAMPAAVRGAVVTRNVWFSAIAGGLLFAAFLILAARYVRLYLRSVESR
jgi:hypothetical protein